MTARDTKSMARLDYSLGGEIVKCHSKATKREAEESRRRTAYKNSKTTTLFYIKMVFKRCLLDIRERYEEDRIDIRGQWLRRDSSLRSE